MFNVKQNNGFTLIETLLVMAVFIILLAISIIALRPFQNQSDLQNSSQEIISALRRAQNKTLASENESTFGIFFNTSSGQYTLFKGTTYASRDSLADEVLEVSDTVEFSIVNLGGGDEIVFDRLEGTTSQPGSITIRLKASPAQTQVAYIDALGVIETTSVAPPSDSARVKDSRHVHVDYIGRPINTATEIITLDFTPFLVTQDIVIADNMSGGQVDWEGEVIVDGETQRFRIHTHLLNEPGFTTQFSLHRDRRFNTKPVLMTISGDVNTLILYDASGLTTQGISSYVSAPDWQ